MFGVTDTSLSNDKTEDFRVVKIFHKTHKSNGQDTMPVAFNAKIDRFLKIVERRISSETCAPRIKPSYIVVFQAGSHKNVFSNIFYQFNFGFGISFFHFIHSFQTFKKY